MKFICSIKFTTPDETIEIVRQALTEYKVIHLYGIPENLDRLSYFERLSDAIGKYFDLNEDLETGKIQEGRWIDITFDPQVPNRYRSSNTHQPLHTDASYLPIENNIQFFFCDSQAAMGGATTFIDTKDLVKAMQLDGQQELLDRLLKVDVCFSKFERNKTRPILIKEGDDYRINYNYYCLDKESSEEAKTLVKDFFDFLEQRVLMSGILTPLPLKKGEAVFFNDERVLHGRNSFFATYAGERKLVKGTIIEWQEA